MIRVQIGPLPALFGDPARVQAILAEARDRAVREIAEGARRDVVEGITEAVPFPPVNEGTMRRDVGITYTPTGAVVASGASTARYAVVQEQGRRPGAKGPPLPRGGGGRAGFGAATADAGLFEKATDPIGWWVRRKLRITEYRGTGFATRRVERRLGGARGLQASGPGRGRRASPAQRFAAAARSLRFLVWRKIHRFGFPGKHFFARARVITEERAPGIVRAYMSEALRRLGKAGG